MPGYVMHLAEARLILDKLEGSRSRSWEQEFLLGSLLPDTRLKEDKAVSHFWNKDHVTDISRAPDLTLFLKKYAHRLDEPIVFGYYAHLYLDACYVNAYWPKMLVFKNKLGQPEKKTAQIDKVEILNFHRTIPFNNFFTKEYYYGDYGRSNLWFIERYHIKSPKYLELEDIGMDEVNYQDIKEVLEEFEMFCSNREKDHREALKVFDLDSLDILLHRTAAKFCSAYNIAG